MRLQVRGRRGPPECAPRKGRENLRRAPRVVGRARRAAHEDLFPARCVGDARRVERADDLEGRHVRDPLLAARLKVVQHAVRHGI